MGVFGKFKKILIYCGNIEYHKDSKVKYPDLVHDVTDNLQTLIPMLNETIHNIELQKALEIDAY